MRDPIFYRWHSFVDMMCRKHKDSLPEYPTQKLANDGIVVQSVAAQISRGNATPNLLLTFWQKSDVDLGSGLDFGVGNVFARFTHLNHAPFNYKITVSSSAPRQGTCRIFIAPKTDERGTALSFNDQRLYMIEMDKFTVNCKRNVAINSHALFMIFFLVNTGDNTIVRRSDESSITIPFERTFRRIGKTDRPADAAGNAQFNYCGCGWPQHMLVPKGTAEGMRFDLFAMISNYADDLVEVFDPTKNCGDAHSFCGLRNKLYPDKRTMGYPFDRVNAATTLADFVTKHSNMKTAEIRIKFNDIVVDE